MKIDAMIAQLNGLEEYLSNGQLESAREAISGIRHHLLTCELHPDENKEIPTPVSDEDLRKLLGEAISLPLNSQHLNGQPTRCSFGGDIVCWGWYDLQIDKAGRSYRWCGEVQEVGIRLPFDARASSIVALSLRPLQPENFTKNSLEVLINGTPTPTRIIPQGDGRVFDLIIQPNSSNEENEIEVTLFVKNGIPPIDLNENSKDKRPLNFNVFEISWLPNKDRT